MESRFGLVVTKSTTQCGEVVFQFVFCASIWINCSFHLIDIHSCSFFLSLSDRRSVYFKSISRAFILSASLTDTVFPFFNLGYNGAVNCVLVFEIYMIYLVSELFPSSSLIFLPSSSSATADSEPNDTKSVMSAKAILNWVASVIFG